jgi:hypothetical protein|tara:strand:+ start:2864 stop:3112 length:249 start_codon:yes stop_codon:yes gene_type:complete
MLKNLLTLTDFMNNKGGVTVKRGEYIYGDYIFILENHNDVPFFETWNYYVAIIQSYLTEDTKYIRKVDIQRNRLELILSQNK